MDIILKYMHNVYYLLFCLKNGEKRLFETFSSIFQYLMK